MKDMNVKTKSTYVWYRDTKMIGTIVLLAIAALQIFAFLRVPVLSTIHGYTIGMLFGWYNPLFYAYAAYFALKMMFGDKVALPKWLKLNHITYWFIAISFIFIGTSLFFYQNKTGYTSIGAEPWGSFKNWFNDFTSEAAWAPANTNGGIVGAFLYALAASITSGIGAIIISIVLAALSVSIVISGSFIGFYKNLINSRKEELKQNEAKAESEFAIDKMAKKIPEDKVLENEEKPKETPQNKQDDFPFEDPFK